jgi:hypothetical protein
VFKPTQFSLIAIFDEFHQVGYDFVDAAGSSLEVIHKVKNVFTELRVSHAE